MIERVDWSVELDGMMRDGRLTESNDKAHLWLKYDT